MPYSTERCIFIYDDKTGDKVYVGPDADSLDMVELRQYYDVTDNKITHRMAFTQEQAILVAKAILELYENK